MPPSLKPMTLYPSSFSRSTIRSASSWRRWYVKGTSPSVDLPCPRLSTPMTLYLRVNSGSSPLKSSMSPKPPWSKRSAGPSSGPTIS
ncbi:hypothetical protein WMF33_15665 [Sorangium sp. So ce394]